MAIPLTAPWPGTEPLASPRAVAAALAKTGYLADEDLAVSLFLGARLSMPVLLEGEAGVGKTEVAQALAAVSGSRLVRLQCHEGIDAEAALYDWDYRRQLLASRGEGRATGELYAREFLLRRPLLEALESEVPVVLLIDEVDRSEEHFEALLLELLGEYQVTIPEVGTVRARWAPFTVLTSNRTRELHDALKRRCLYQWIEYPSRARELEIVRSRCPGLADEIAERVCTAVERLRAAELYKPPGVGETLAWAQALEELGGAADLDATLGVVLKVREDVVRVRAEGALADA